MSVRLFSDSACDMTQAEAREIGVTVLPLKTIIDGVEYLDGVTLSASEFYERLAGCKALPTTSQITPAEFTAALGPAVEAGDEAVVVTISAKLSGTAQSAAIAAEGYEGRVYVVDSGNVTAGQNILLRYAVRLRDQGLPAGEIAAELERVKGRICLLARVDTLEYLMKGGRLSKTAAIAGTILNIKPVISVENGEIKVLGKARGTRQSDNLLTEFVDRRGADFSMPVMLAYTGRDDSLLRSYIDSSRALWEGRLAELPIAAVGSTIGTHAGPGAVAVAFFARE